MGELIFQSKKTSNQPDALKPSRPRTVLQDNRVQLKRTGRKQAMESGGGTPPISSAVQVAQPVANAPPQAAGIVQRVPAMAGVPVADGMDWDTLETTDHNGAIVPSDVIAVMRNPAYGGVPSVDPPGWDWLKTKFGRLKGQWVRFHIINAELGGPGNDTDNLVPTVVALNHNGGWRTLEDNAKASATDDADEDDSTWTYLQAALGYDDNYPAGIPATIDAQWGQHDGAAWQQVGGNVHLAQINPDDGDNNHYLPAAQITVGRLRQFGFNQAEAPIMKALIDDTWADQQAFEDAVAQAEEDDGAGSNGWFNALGRMYVDEDDDIPGPYGVVVRNT
jgi:hypothetical protein